MRHLTLTVLRLLPALLFLTYATYANWTMATGREPPFSGLSGSVVSGTAMAELDQRYSHALPHRTLSSGVYGALRYMAVGEGRKGVVVGRHGWLFTDEEMRAASDDEVDRAVALVADVARQLSARGTQLVVVPLPAKADVAAGWLNQPQASAAMEAQYHAFAAGLARADVAMVDARPALLAGGSSTFLRTDTHWTPLGASRVAAAVAASGLVAQGDARFQSRALPKEGAPGDLATFVTSAPLAPLVGLAEEQVAPFVAEPVASPTDDEGGIFADAASGFDVVLVGTSYSADPRWSFAPALSLALGRDVANLASIGQGPFRPMLDFLATDDFANPPPALAIWEIPIRYLGDPAVWPKAGTLRAKAASAREDVHG